MPKTRTKPLTSPTSERLRFSTAILRLLGEELNPSPDQGILELIKNSYDADATRCTAELKGVHIKGGSIRLVDDGVGMTSGEIRNGWLIVGDSMKSRSEKSPSGRLLVGSKGLGRLGALRLGRKVELVTRPKSEPGIQYRVEIDWSAFDHAKVVEDVELTVRREKAAMGTSHGTEILISQLPPKSLPPALLARASSAGGREIIFCGPGPGAALASLAPGYLLSPHRGSGVSWGNYLGDAFPSEICSRPARNFASMVKSASAQALMMTNEDDFEDDDQYPWEDVEASRKKQRLQREHPVTEGQTLYAARAKACPRCQTAPSQLDWFYFESPEETWEHLCGRAGWMTVCDSCHLQVNFFLEALN